MLTYDDVVNAKLALQFVQQRRPASTYTQDYVDGWNANILNRDVNRRPFSGKGSKKRNEEFQDGAGDCQYVSSLMYSDIISGRTESKSQDPYPIKLIA